MKASVCALLYGNHPTLAHACLRSILSALKQGPEYVQDIRLGLNETSDATQVVVDWLVESIRGNFPQIPVIQYACRKNAFKYPLMRRMLLDDLGSLADWVMWFDDDSWLTVDRAWWGRLELVAEPVDMVGKIYWQGAQAKQWDWIQQQTWFNPDVGYVPPAPQKLRIVGGRPAFQFCTGGWWVARSKIFLENDWPTKDLKLVGGDAMLGELCRHRGYQLANFESGVHINAGPSGRHNSAPPRGESPPGPGRNRVRLGIADSPAAELHNFICTRSVH